eukprot:Nk52_evm23s745 gene=Nk52_evmTU23s745
MDEGEWKKRRNKDRVEPVRGLFNVDTVPDPDNVRYESLYKAGVPLYRQRFKSCVDGRSSERQWIARKKVKEELLLNKKRRYFNGKLPLLEKNTSEKDWRLKPCVTVEKEKEDEQEMVPLEKESGARVEECSAEELYNRQSAEFNALLEQDVGNVGTWVAFVRFQSIFWSGRFHQRKSNRVAIAKKQLSILDRALVHNPGNELLIALFMEVSQLLWDGNKLISKWRSVMFQYSDSVFLWGHYLAFRTHHMQSFSFASAEGLYRQFCEGNYCTNSEGREEQVVFMCLVYFYQECGYFERSIELFRCLLSIDLSRYEMKPYLFEGEQEYLDTKQKPMPFKWAHLESTRGEGYYLPWRPNEIEGSTESQVEDKDRIAIERPWIEKSKNNVLRYFKNDYEVLKQFLISMGVCAFPMRRCQFEDHRGWLNMLCCAHLLHLRAVKPIVDMIGNLDEHLSYLTDFDVCTGHLDSMLFFFSHFSERKAGFIRHLFKNYLDEYEKYDEFILAYARFEALVSGRKKAKKVLKSLLQREANRNRTVLWKEMAHFEVLSGKPQAALSLCQSLLEYAPKTPGDTWAEMDVKSAIEKFKYSSLLRLYCHVCLETKSKNKLVNGLVAGNDASALNLVSLIEFASNARNKSVEFVHAIGNHMICILFYWLEGAANVPEFIHSCEHLLSLFPSTKKKVDPWMDYLVEFLCAGMADICRVLCTNETELQFAKKKAYRNLMTRLILPRFPSNLLLWLSFAGSAKDAFQTRKLLGALKLATRVDVEYHILAINALFLEVYQTKFVRNRYKLRSAFQKLLLDDHESLELTLFFSPKHIVALWRLYMYIDALFFKHPGSIESIFYQSIQFIPYSKSLYKDAVLYYYGLKGHNDSFFSSVIETLREKELRLYVLPEELYN